MSLAIDPQVNIPNSVFSGNENNACKDSKAMLKVCQKFESFFIQFMFQKMRDALPKDGILGESTSMNWYQEMLDKEVAKQMAKKQSLGIAETLYQQFYKKEDGQEKLIGSSTGNNINTHK